MQKIDKLQRIQTFCKMRCGSPLIRLMKLYSFLTGMSIDWRKKF